MGIEGKPKAVIDALARGDHKTLRELGRSGAEHAALYRLAEKKRKEDIISEREHELARTEHLSPEGDVLPPENEEVSE